MIHGIPSGVCIVGASGSGKSTAVAMLRAMVGDTVDLPLRYVTRPARSDDDPRENLSLIHSQFEEKWTAGEIFCRWEKPIPGAGTVHYGFATPKRANVLLSGNSDLLTGASTVRPTDALAFMKYVLLTCEPNTRMNRIASRDPKLRKGSAEWRKRAQDDTTTLVPLCDVVIDTTGGILPPDLDPVLKLLERA